MNIFRPQKPYEFRPPKFQPILAPLLQKLSERLMREKFKIRNITVEGDGELGRLAADGASLLIAPNHADHPDPHILLYAGKKHGLHFHFMAAREGFEKHQVSAFMLQRMGCFSVDREGADLSAVRTAMQIVQEGKYPLVIFPEGEIYHHHEKLDDLNAGVATIVLRASGKVRSGKRCCVVPAAIRYRYDEEVESTFSERMDVLETRIHWKPRPELPVVDRIYRFGRGMLALKEEEFLGHAQTGNLVERIADLQESLVSMIEDRRGAAAAGLSVPERIRWLRGRIRGKLIDRESRPSQDEEKQMYDDLDTIFLAAQLYSYPGQYLRDEPSFNRIAETILKLEEDVLEKGTYPAPMDANVRFGKPIDVAEFMKEHGLDVKSAVNPITRCLSERIQEML
ncbi:MAG: 1-acyl-sn-glycerol-3-phosphate acyltransferase [Kiritimatiellia bacterium]|jgi:hypothetical protein|nr:1-acyl-sn-glycerol-3-phosphate acyltransferase [Kiritimatiellia bacterium]